MKVKTDDIPLEMGGVKVEGEFRIRNSAKAFSILSSGLYANKVEAILRELGCNAYDSHVEAGKANVPFTVHLPTTLNPQFYVRDYGIGLDHEGVTQLYTTYFESTKQDSNDYVGCLGLGSKSPFSYTRNFTVTAIKDGVERIYNCFINEQGIPSVALLNEMETEKGNGVEVRFAVNNRSDMNEFSKTAQKVYRWFKVKPEIIGNAVTIPEIEFKERDIAPGVHLLQENYSNNYYQRSFAMMGNVVYPIKLPQQDGIPENFRKLIERNNYLMEFEIGELDVAASREELSYDEATVKALIAKCDLLIKKAEQYLETQVNNEKTDWEKACKLISISKSDSLLFTAATRAYINNKANPTLKKMVDTEYGVRIKLILDKEEEVPEVGLVGMEIQYGDEPRLSRHNLGKDWHTGNIDTCVGPETVFLVQDDRGNLFGRIREAAKQKKNGLQRGSILLIVRRERKNGDTAKMWSVLSKKLGNPPVLYSSKLPKPPPPIKTKHGEVKAYTFERCSGNSRYAPDVYRFRTGPKKLANFKRIDGKIVYLPLHGKQAKWGDKVISASDLLMKLVDKNDGVLALINHGAKEQVSTDTIYGVNGDSLKAAEKDAGWISLFDLVNDRFNKMDWTALENDVERAAKAAVLDREDLFVGTNYHRTTAMMSYDHPTSPFGELAREARLVAGSKEILEELHRLERAVRLLPDRRGTVEALAERQRNAAEEMQALIQRVRAAYPLLCWINSYNKKDAIKAVHEYVEAIDNRKN